MYKSLFNRKGRFGTASILHKTFSMKINIFGRCKIIFGFWHLLFISVIFRYVKVSKSKMKSVKLSFFNSIVNQKGLIINI